MPQPDIHWSLSFDPEHICPAPPGWRAVWKTSLGDYYTAPVVCWATGWRVQQERVRVDDADGKGYCYRDRGEPVRERAAFGLVSNDGYLGCPEEDDTFRGYVGPGEPLE